MKSGDVEEIDFKPFFDMIVGVLFVFLILIAAQMFFSQWGASPEQRSREEAQRQRRIDWERQIASFLEDTAGRLAAAGLEPRVDRAAQAISVPLGKLAAFEGGALRVSPEPAGALGRNLEERLRCVAPGQAAPPAGCSSLPLLQLGGVASELRLTGWPTEAGLPADRFGELAATLVHAGVLGASPELLAVPGAGGRPALRAPTATTVGAPVAGGGPQGDIVLRFGFAEP